MLGIQQGTADPGVQPHLVIDRLALALKLLLMLILRRAEQLDQDTVVQVNDLVGDGGHPFQHHRNQGGIAPFALELGEIGRCHLRALAGELQQAVLVNAAADAFRQAQRLEGLETFDVLDHVPRVGFQRRLPQPQLPQPHQPGEVAVRSEPQQVVEETAMMVVQRLDQGPVDASVGARDGLGAGAFDDGQRRQDDPPMAQRLQRVFREQQPLVGLHRKVGQRLRQVAEVGQAERRQPEIGAQLLEVLAPRLVALAILRPSARLGSAARRVAWRSRSGWRRPGAAGSAPSRIRRRCRSGLDHPGSRAARAGWPARWRRGSNGGACSLLLLENVGLRQARQGSRRGTENQGIAILENSS